MTLPAFAAERRRRPAAIDLSAAGARRAQQQTRHTPLSIDGTDGLTQPLH